jgi:hypothetical protein
MIEYDAGWAPQPIWTIFRREKLLVPYLEQTTIPVTLRNRLFQITSEEMYK